MDRPSTIERWREPRLEAAPDAGQLRVRFTYDAWYSTYAGFSVKSRRAVYCEAATEAATWIEAEVDTCTTDLQFQPIRIVWRRDHGATRHITLDAGFEHEDGSIVFAECKSHPVFLQELRTADLLDEAEEVLAREGARLERLTGVDLLDPVRRKAHWDVFRDRSARYDADDVAKALEAVAAEGGTAPLGRVLEALGGRRADANARLNGMSVRRIVRIDLSAPRMPDTPVDVPPVAGRGRLRRFLMRHGSGA